MRRLTGREWLRWGASFLAFPVGGLAARAVVGDLDDTWAALVGGAVVGLVIGAGQALALPTRLPPFPWVAATTVGSAAGLAVGAALVDYGTDLGDLAAMGAVTGAAIGVLQALVLPGSAGVRAVWAIVSVALWALGWTVTTLARVDVERQHAVFGATGAITWTVLAGLVLGALLPARQGSVRQEVAGR